MHIADDRCPTCVEDTIDEVLNTDKGLASRTIAEFTNKEGLPLAACDTVVIASSHYLAATVARVSSPSAIVADSVRRLVVD